MNNVQTDWQRLQQSVLTVEQVRAVDQLAVDEYAMHSLVLMENAARSCMAVLERMFPTLMGRSTRSIVILCGKGNNGGDGLAIARHAEYLGWDCSVFVAGSLIELSPDARANAQILLSGNSGCAVHLGWHEHLQPLLERQIMQADVVLDAMLGTGAQGAPRGAMVEWIQLANRSSARRIAIDMPTGVDATTGSAAAGSYFQAASTLTFVARKPAMALEHAQHLFGEIEVLSIGIPLALIQRLLTWQ